MFRKILASASAIALSIGALPAAAHAQDASNPTPAMWTVSDEDTTIYLFGTVHILPEGTEFMNPTITAALESSDQFVSEIDTSLIPEFDPASGNPPPPEIMEIAQMQAQMAQLTTGGTLRDLLNDEQRAFYEETMTELGLPVAAFDAFEPWFAAMNIAQIAFMQAGLDPANGVERRLDHLIEGKDRAAFETVEQQMTFFDTLPLQSQIAFLVSDSNDVDDMEEMFGEMVGEWIEGDPVGLASMINEPMSEDAHLYYNLLTQRNYAWADWIDTRLDQPGTVFIAVGAGHLAGEYSVQDFLEQRGITAERVQY
ncbi:TraB/GumN family protein [Aurantiacibacter sediminis]|uniref:TraB/GumN family protein n=1 Tax=Aurantiacibacter sediminis TaxID=2793064 RepID=A0ABS0N3W8_9SPHN|nr:TraB/GumN family protein [Aurantiacibacter sediminis]MBH5322665.1 TraB/GumN family protein [Aurantiacibacter sediminis]